jgi:Holliday junction DNA helicase RuvA
VASKQPDIAEEAESALIALGYKPQDAAKMVSRAVSDDISSAEQLIRAALKSMVSK